MSAVMVDTSVWIDYFRGRQKESVNQLSRLLQEDRVAICGMIELELLRGVRGQERSRLELLLSAPFFFDTLREDFVAAGNRICLMQQNGITLSASDALIAEVCIRNRILLLTTDLHFEHFTGLDLFGRG